ncbi:MAG: hypothetical protein V3S06_01325 [candidate division Zixibacteria bacterium]
MKKIVVAALMAVFFSVVFSGCFTKLKGPDPQTGERRYSDYSYYDDYYWYDDYYYSSFYYRSGWLSPYFYGYPYYGYGSFYSPYWYDSGYYYGNGGRNRSDKSVRYRRRGRGSSPGGFTSPPLRPRGSGGTVSGTVRTKTSSGGSRQPAKPTRSGGKSARRRR